MRTPCLKPKLDPGVMEEAELDQPSLFDVAPFITPAPFAAAGVGFKSRSRKRRISYMKLSHQHCN